MRHRFVIPALSAACYAALGELFFRSDRTVRDAWGDCVETPADYAPIALAIGAIVFVASAAWAARSEPARWKAATALQAAAALLAGGMVGDLWYDQRMVRGSACVRMEFCTWCQTRWWESPLIAFTLLAIVGALLALPIGALARRLPPARRRQAPS